MCGIAGISYLKESGFIDLELIKEMIGAISHRGPDESGIYLDDYTGLGHARLSIIDLAGGTQPIHNEDESLWIVYNGEIFNYPELRDDLERNGHRFYTSTDTEVIIHLFEEKGASCLDDLNGQFAFAIWNSRKKELFLARDRVGIIPLHYTVHENSLIFASEIKALFMAGSIDRSIDPVAMDQIFTFWTTLSGRTLFKDIYELPPGHYLHLYNGKMNIRKYWDVPSIQTGDYTDMSFTDACDYLRELILDAVRIRLRADVPVGCYLSGGLDSSGVTAMVKKNFNNQLRTFGIRFEENEFDEGEFQGLMVSDLQTDHTDIRTRNEQISTSFYDVLWHTEKPVLRTAPVPLYLLSREVHNSGFKVVLTGEGADEVFGGYNIFREAKVRRFWARQPDSKFRPLLIGKLYPYIFDNNSRARHFIQSFFGNGLEDSDYPLFSHLIRWQNTSRTKVFFSEELKREIGDYNGYDDLLQNLPEEFNSRDYLSRAQYLETTVFLSNYLLSSQGDRVAMAHSVEVRPPYLDHRIIEFMGKVPPEWKIRVLEEKHLLKEVLRGTLPERIVNRSKHPYRAPIKESLLDESLPRDKEFLSERSLNETGLFDIQKVEKLLKKMYSADKASEVDNMALAGILSSQIVYDRFVENFSYQASQIHPKLIIDRRKAKGIRRKRCKA